MSEVTLFVRKASGLVRSWSMFDAFIYATFSINLITLGLYIFSYCYYFEGNIATAVVIGGLFTIFEVVVYASLISAMPRAGGDYVWQSRILGRGIGFVLAVTGWWFILWLWVPLYADMLRFEVFTPLLAIVGAQDAVAPFREPQGRALLSSDCQQGCQHFIAQHVCIQRHPQPEDEPPPGDGQHKADPASQDAALPDVIAACTRHGRDQAGIYDHLKDRENTANHDRSGQVAFEVVAV